jgi:carbon storage regulator
MLVLSRRESQRIRVGDSVVVTIVKIGGDKVRVGIDAPSDVLVLRDELEVWDKTDGTSGLTVETSTHEPLTSPSAIHAA